MYSKTITSFELDSLDIPEETASFIRLRVKDLPWAKTVGQWANRFVGGKLVLDGWWYLKAMVQCAKGR